MEEKIEKSKAKSSLKWKRVEYAFVENKIRGQFKICSLRLGQSSKYKLMRSCSGMWNEIGPPANSSWEYCKDEAGNELLRMCRFGSPVSNDVKILGK